MLSLLLLMSSPSLVVLGLLRGARPGDVHALALGQSSERRMQRRRSITSATVVPMSRSATSAFTVGPGVSSALELEILTLESSTTTLV
jgi:hypothetical protein